jgi:hypothetical protein
VATGRQSEPENSPRRHRAATTPKAREDQLVALATDLAEKQLREGTASAQVISHFLKMGSMREELERERLHQENLLLAAKTDAIAQAGRMEELVKDAIAAMRTYRTDQGMGDEQDDR